LEELRQTNAQMENAKLT